MDTASTNSWVDAEATFYSMIPRQWTIDLLCGEKLSLLGSTFAALAGGKTETLVFRKGELG